MNPRERMINALSLQEPDDFCPVWEIEFHLFNEVSPRPLVISQEYTKLTAAEKDRALHENAEIMIQAAQDLGLSALSNIGPYWEIAPGAPAPMWFPPEDSKRFLPLLCQASRGEIFIMEWCPAMLYMPDSDQFLDFSYKLFDAPEEVDNMAKQQLEKGMEIAHRARDAGADGLCAACDIADNHGMYFSPAQFDRFFLPYLQIWAEAVRKIGLKSILHSDGDLAEVLEKLADTELNGLQSIDPVAGMDIVEVKKQVGDRLCLCGNIHLGLLYHGSVEAIREEVKRICIGCKTGGGFVLGATNAVFEEIPIKHYKIMLNAGREFGSYNRQNEKES